MHATTALLISQPLLLVDDLETKQIADAQIGNLAAFNQLILRYQTVAFGIAMRMIGDEQGASDVVHESFIKAYRTIKTFTGGSFKCWLLQIVSNRSLVPLPNPQRAILQMTGNWGERKTLTQLTVDASVSPQMHTEPFMLNELLERAINTVSPDLRIALLLHDVHGCTCEEIATIIAVSPDTVTQQLSQARSLVRAYL